MCKKKKQQNVNAGLNVGMGQRESMARNVGKKMVRVSPYIITLSFENIDVRGTYIFWGSSWGPACAQIQTNPACADPSQSPSPCPRDLVKNLHLLPPTPPSAPSNMVRDHKKTMSWNKDPRPPHPQCLLQSSMAASSRSAPCRNASPTF